MNQNEAVIELAKTVGDKESVADEIPTQLAPLFGDCGATHYLAKPYAGNRQFIIVALLLPPTLPVRDRRVSQELVDMQTMTFA